MPLELIRWSFKMKIQLALKAFNSQRVFKYKPGAYITKSFQVSKLPVKESFRILKTLKSVLRKSVNRIESFRHKCVSNCFNHECHRHNWINILIARQLRLNVTDRHCSININVRIWYFVKTRLWQGWLLMTDKVRCEWLKTLRV